MDLTLTDLVRELDAGIDVRPIIADRLDELGYDALTAEDWTAPDVFALIRAGDWAGLDRLRDQVMKARARENQWVRDREAAMVRLREGPRGRPNDPVAATERGEEPGLPLRPAAGPGTVPGQVSPALLPGDDRRPPDPSVMVQESLDWTGTGPVLPSPRDTAPIPAAGPTRTKRRRRRPPGTRPVTAE